MKILADSSLYPDKRVLAEALGEENYSLFVKFAEQMETLNLTLEWRYYNDGKEWLCKILNKKKNLGWLSIWENSFRVTVFLTAKTINGFHALAISDEIKTYAKEAKPTGKLIPTITTINTESVIDDMLKILEYKKQLK
jgi:hypothetical protein